MSKSLFLLKLREDYSANPLYSTSPQIATGMWNSAKFVVDDLRAAGQEADIGVLVDGNSIDRAVVSYDPTHVFIEGLWVTPAKMRELMALGHHSGRKWIVRIHSDIPFLATEGIAEEWIAEYLHDGVIVAPNDAHAFDQLKWQFENLASPPAGTLEELLVYLPNCYPTADFMPIKTYVDSPEIHIACFGAFRPLKNHLNQAYAALKFAEKLGKKLVFHVNNRLDSGGQPVAKNIEGLFNSLDPTVAQLVIHGWEDRETFIASLRQCDLLMQVSMSETFNIVAADALLAGIPVLLSKEIVWAFPLTADPQDVTDIVKKLELTWRARNFTIQKNRTNVTRYAQTSKRLWLDYLT